MGRHGGGSRSGGSSGGSRSGGGSRGGGSGARVSSTPFSGCYNRSYYDRKGKYHSYYTSDRSYGSKSGFSGGLLFALIFVTVHMLIMMSSFGGSIIRFGGKVDGDIRRIKIVDNANALTDAEEQQTITLLKNVYDVSGMPVTVYTDSFEWKQYYTSLEVYSEELYYAMGFDEAAMIILFTTNNDTTFYNWEYDMYCGDDTIKCLSDPAFDKLINNFHKGMSGQSLYRALEYSLNSIMNDLAKTSVNWSESPILLVLAAFYGIFYYVILGGMKQRNDAYQYFQQNPHMLEQEPMRMYSECPNCNASNAAQSETCLYCGTLLKISDSNVQFVKPE